MNKIKFLQSVRLAYFICLSEGEFMPDNFLHFDTVGFCSAKNKHIARNSYKISLLTRIWLYGNIFQLNVLSCIIESIDLVTIRTIVCTICKVPNLSRIFKAFTINKQNQLNRINFANMCDRKVQFNAMPCCRKTTIVSLSLSRYVWQFVDDSAECTQCTISARSVQFSWLKINTQKKTYARIEMSATNLKKQM